MWCVGCSKVFTCPPSYHWQNPGGLQIAGSYRKRLLISENDSDYETWSWCFVYAKLLAWLSTCHISVCIYPGNGWRVFFQSCHPALYVKWMFGEDVTAVHFNTLQHTATHCNWVGRGVDVWRGCHCSTL